MANSGSGPDGKIKLDVRRGLATTALFLFCAIPGLVAFVGGLMALLDAILFRRPLAAALSLAVGMGGGLMILVGTRRWGQWAWALVPIVFLATAVSLMFAPVFDDPKGIGQVFVAGVLAVLTSAGVGYYYHRREKRGSHERS